MKELAAALFLLLGSPVEESTIIYDRSTNFGGWRDLDGDCLNTRHEVLEWESLIGVWKENCRVISGLWFDPYTGEFFTNPSDLDIDHVVPLLEAWQSGAHEWTQEERRDYSNYVGGLLAVESRANRQKGAGDPADWLPSRLRSSSFDVKGIRCAYIIIWMRIKIEWSLTWDAAEKTAIKGVIEEDCGG